MTTPLNGYAVIDGTWYEIGPVDDRGNGLVIVAAEADPETLAETMSAWEERVGEIIERHIAFDDGPEDSTIGPGEAAAADISATLWEGPA